MDPDYGEHMNRFRRMLREKTESLGDPFPPSSWYRKDWVKDRVILRTATGTSHSLTHTQLLR